MDRPIIALLYDFDKTLCTTDMEDYTFIPALGYKPAVTDDPTIKLPPIDGSAIPSDFKLSLDELKFGRNYGDNK